MRGGTATTIQPWQFFLLASIGLATLVVVSLRGQPVAVIVLAALTVVAGGAAAFAVYRTCLPLLGEGTGEDTAMLAGRTRAALERDKLLTLRAIKELEFDRAMGKVAEGDFADMRDRLRARALRLMTQLDGATAYREMIERDVEARLAGGEPPVHAAASVERHCTACGSANEDDARFCKMCGHVLQAAS